LIFEIFVFQPPVPHNKVFPAGTGCLLDVPPSTSKIKSKLSKRDVPLKRLLNSLGPFFLDVSLVIYVNLGRPHFQNNPICTSRDAPMSTGFPIKQLKYWFYFTKKMFGLVTKFI